MKKELCSAVMTSIEALLQVPGTQLQHIESTLRQLLADLKAANITPPAELDELIEDAAVAHAEEMAYMNGVAWGDEPYFQEPDEEYREAMIDLDEGWDEYEEGLMQRASENPEAYKKLAQFLDDELPF